jgi:hypothetical protein
MLGGGLCGCGIGIGGWTRWGSMLVLGKRGRRGRGEGEGDRWDGRMCSVFLWVGC